MKKEIAELRSILQKADEERSDLNRELERLRKELFNYTIANTLETELGVEEGKKRIDDLLDEIDKCIAVLSD